jgi:hypothetical protein
MREEWQRMVAEASVAQNKTKECACFKAYSDYIPLRSFSRGALLEGVLRVEEDAVPATCLASRTREAGGHRPSPLRGRADRSAATALVNGGKTVGISQPTPATAGSKGRAGVRQSGPPAKSPAMARQSASRGGEGRSWPTSS